MNMYQIDWNNPLVLGNPFFMALTFQLAAFNLCYESSIRRSA